MKNKRYVYSAVLIVLFIVGGFMIFGPMIDNLGTTVIKPITKKATGLSFCPKSPELMFSLNTTLGNLYGQNERTQKYVTFDDFANALQSELAANANATRCSYKITLYYQDENERKVTLDCGKTSFKPGDHNIFCATPSGSGSSGRVYITDREASLEIYWGSGFQEFVKIPAYYVEKMNY